MVGTGIQHSVLTEPIGPITKKKVWIQEATDMNYLKTRVTWIGPGIPFLLFHS